MDPVMAVLVNLGGGFTMAAVILLLHREALRAFREELAAERSRNDVHLATLFSRMDGIKEAMLMARCKLPDRTTLKATHIVQP